MSIATEPKWIPEQGKSVDPM